MQMSILKPQNDKCLYQTFKLQNNLNVFLVEDQDTDLACATMLVKIGYSYDTIPGIAHFLEHMLFNGTKKYPGEKEYSDYINKNGGYSNAFTSHDHTCYYYTIQPECLKKSLDMFGSFFTEPLFNPDSVNREKEAVDSEHSKNILSDMWRIQEIKKNAIVSTNPIKNFGTGSNKTLGVPDIHNKVKHFFERHYSSDLMTLFVIAKNDIENIKSQIISIFSKIPLNITPENRVKYGNKIYDSSKILKVVPVKDIEKLTISWDVPSYHNEPLRSPHNFLAYLIGHEGKNTIHYFLTQLGYITELYAGSDFNCEDRVIFEVGMTLTPSGMEHKKEIIYTIINYINLLKDKLNTKHFEKLYNELLTLNAFKFKYSEKNSPDERTLKFADLVSKYNFDLHDLLIIPYTTENYEPFVKHNILEMLSEMTIEKSIVVSISKSHKDEAIYEDEHYGTKYYISNEYVDLSGVSLDTTLLDLPVENKFISISDKIINTTSEKPYLLKTNNYTKLYSLPTNEFEVPNVVVKVKIDLPMANYNKEMYTKTMLYFNSLMAEINDEMYMCKMAEYDINVTFDFGVLYITMSGNYGNIEKVSDYLVSSLLNKNMISEKIFDTAMYQMKMAHTNCVYNSPYKRTHVLFNKQMCHIYYDNCDMLSVLNDCNVCNIDNVKNVIDSILDLSSCTMFVTGNCTDELSLKLSDIFSGFIKNRNYVPDAFLCDIYGEPSDCDNKIIKSVENTQEKNSASSYYVFISKLKYGLSLNWNKYICLLNILDRIISTDYFDTLRTKEEFGYICSGYINIVGDRRYMSRYYTFTVQSPNKKPDEIISRTERFLLEMKDRLSNLNDEEFDDIKDALTSSLEAPFNNLEEMASFVFSSEIETEYTAFNLKDALIETYRELNKDDLIDFFHDKFLINRKSLAVGLIGN